MITEALLHCPGIGPVRVEKLVATGIRSWADVIEHGSSITNAAWMHDAIAECRRCVDALAKEQIQYFCERFHPKDRWRILQRYQDNVTFFDIETAGLEYDDPVTVIACWHRGEAITFVENENLDEFLDLLEDVTLLSSFNGSTFDVPRVLDTFHIPELPCPHLDLRWLCFHRELKGGLKQIANRLRIRRPDDLYGVHGEMAIRYWQRWIHFQDEEAKKLLLRYAVSDVLLLVALADRLLGQNRVSLAELWRNLPSDSSLPEKPTSNSGIPVVDRSFGDASPTKLRGRRAG